MMPTSISDLSRFYLRNANSFPRLSRQHPNRVGITLFWDCENIGGSNFLMFLPQLIRRIFTYFEDLDCALEFRGCFAALRQTKKTRTDCCALMHAGWGLYNAGINIDIIPEDSGAEAADLSLYGIISFHNH